MQSRCASFHHALIPDYQAPEQKGGSASQIVIRLFSGLILMLLSIDRRCEIM